MLFVMNDVEKRRVTLLQETRKNYPAVHPRFHATYDSIYGAHTDEETEFHGSFLLRTMIAVLLFALFFVMDYRNEKVGMVDSKIVIQEVQKNLLSQ